ncbi:DUF1499 domain-containing protein [Aliamphritea ceti]|uniref:DUF1499 domain-containing protein n=1 Tax=Aliamphritea ceti TaxID=1524258 RepID=UPI0021C34FCE|nr:DUF1499 domain-containing protein [Aliamphritea ceti]
MLLKSIIAIFTLMLIAMFAMGWWSHKTTTTASGLKNGQLTKCPDTPNCVNSEAFAATAIKNTTQDEAKIAAVSLPDKPLDELKLDIIHTLDRMGADNLQWQDAYLATTFTTRIFRFVDDFELRIDQASGELHIRSASRVGKSDFSANRKRTDTFREQLKQAGW